VVQPFAIYPVDKFSAFYGNRSLPHSQKPANPPCSRLSPVMAFCLAHSKACSRLIEFRSTLYFCVLHLQSFTTVLACRSSSPLTQTMGQTA